MSKNMCLVFGFILAFALGFSVLANAEGKGDPVKGKASYSTSCLTCHGAEGKGDGVAAAALNPKPRDLTDAQYMSALSNEHLFKVISNGGEAVGKSPLMPALNGSLTEDDIWNVISFIRNDLCKCAQK